MIAKLLMSLIADIIGLGDDYNSYDPVGLWREQNPEQVKTLYHQWVAVTVSLKPELIDHDASFDALYKRIRARKDSNRIAIGGPF
jgi:hypothetical protein